LLFYWKYKHPCVRVKGAGEPRVELRPGDGQAVGAAGTPGTLPDGRYRPCVRWEEGRPVGTAEGDHRTRARAVRTRCNAPGVAGTIWAMRASRWSRQAQDEEGPPGIPLLACLRSSSQFDHGTKGAIHAHSPAF